MEKLLKFRNNRFVSPIWSIFKFICEFIIIAFLVITIVFFLIDSMPGENGLLQGADAVQRKVIIAKYHLDDPSIVRYGRYLSQLMHGDFGVSTTLFPQVNINDFVWSRFLTSFTIGSISVVITLLLGVPLGIWIGKNPGKMLDSVSTVVVAIFISIPSMVFGLMLLLLGKSLHIPYVYDATNIASWFLPAIALSIGGVITYIRFIRTELNSELNSMHAKFAYLKGVSKTRFIWRHALKPSLFPVATFFPMIVLGSFIGSLFIEKIFQIPGSGAMFLNAIQTKDQNVILFFILLFSLLTIISYTLRDLLYGLMDPRIRRG